MYEVRSLGLRFRVIFYTSLQKQIRKCDSRVCWYCMLLPRRNTSDLDWLSDPTKGPVDQYLPRPPHIAYQQDEPRPRHEPLHQLEPRQQDEPRQRIEPGQQDEPLQQHKSRSFVRSLRIPNCRNSIESQSRRTISGEATQSQIKGS